MCVQQREGRKLEVIKYVSRIEKREKKCTEIAVNPENTHEKIRHHISVTVCSGNYDRLKTEDSASSLWLLLHTLHKNICCRRHSTRMRNEQCSMHACCVCASRNATSSFIRCFFLFRFSSHANFFSFLFYCSLLLSKIFVNGRLTRQLVTWQLAAMDCLVCCSTQRSLSTIHPRGPCRRTQQMRSESCTNHSKTQSTRKTKTQPLTIDCRRLRNSAKFLQQSNQSIYLHYS